MHVHSSAVPLQIQFRLPSLLQVPVQYMHFANTTQQCPDYWEDESSIRADLELEAVGNSKAETFVAMVRAHRALVERFLAGDLDKNDDAGVQVAMVDLGLIEGEEDPIFAGMELNRAQKRLEKALCTQLDRAKRGRLAANDKEWEEVVEEAYNKAKPLFVTGPPGTGKSTVVDKCVRKCLREGGRVLYALPTAQQASRVRAEASRSRRGHLFRSLLPLPGCPRSDGLLDAVRHGGCGRDLPAVAVRL